MKTKTVDFSDPNEASACRFDMLHVMVDEPDDDMDSQIATHIVKVHQRRERAFNVPYTMSQVQRYIKYARSIKPQVSPQVGPCSQPAMLLDSPFCKGFVVDPCAPPTDIQS